MAIFEVKTTASEQETILKVLRQHSGETIAVSAIAQLAKMPQSRTRYTIDDLITAGKVERIATKAFNPRYMRYAYTVKD